MAKEILNSPYSGQIAEGDLVHFRNLDKKSQEEYAKFVRSPFEAQINAMTLSELMEQDNLVYFGRQGLEFDYLFGSAADKARIDYSKLRFEELMAQEIIDWRDPQYMEKLNAYVNKTGLDPRTVKEVQLPVIMFL